jgi:hypothetical protein
MFSRLASNCKLQEPCRYRSFRVKSSHHVGHFEMRNVETTRISQDLLSRETEETEIRLHIFQREVPFSFLNNIPALQCEELFSSKPEQSHIRCHINLGSRSMDEVYLRMASIPREPRPSPASNRHESLRTLASRSPDCFSDIHTQGSYMPQMA